MPFDLVILVADKNFEYGMQGLLSRPRALGIRGIQVDIYVHPGRDPGCFRRAHEFLRRFSRDYQHALVMFDREGSGQDGVPASAIAADLRSRLAANGWESRAEVIVLDPELEIWVFAPSPHVEQCLGWRREDSLRNWLENEGLWRPNDPKPDRPKEALERILYELKRPRSSSLYECLGRSVGVRRCADPAFQTLCRTLAGWFP